MLLSKATHKYSTETHVYSLMGIEPVTLALLAAPPNSATEKATVLGERSLTLTPSRGSISALLSCQWLDETSHKDGPFSHHLNKQRSISHLEDALFQLNTLHCVCVCVCLCELLCVYVCVCVCVSVLTVSKP